MPEGSADDRDPIVIKKYANRRLYNTKTASFVKLDDLHQMVKDGEDFVVRDEKTGRDITASILAQIIAEEETKGHSVLPHEYLRQVLKAYSEGVGPQLATYLEQSMDAFAQQQRSFTRQMQEMFDGGAAVEQLADISRRNLEEFQRRMGFPMPGTPTPEDATEHPDPTDGDDEAAALKRKIADLEDRIAKLEDVPPKG